jgi:serine/threonine protein kinase
MDLGAVMSTNDPEEDFNLEEKLGEGSYGSVWQGSHKATGTQVAIKRVPIENDLKELLVEIEHMKNCDSSYIVKLFGSYKKDNELWIIMEMCSAGSAADVMKVIDRPFNEPAIAHIAAGTLQGLHYLHSVARKIHRDIKAGNLLVSDEGGVKLADFGVTGQLSDNYAKRHTVIGTPFWMAPEIIQEVGYEFKADIWSLGITLIELAEMVPPYANIHPMRAIFMIPSKPPPTLKEAASVSRDFNDIVKQCLTKAPEDRPNSEALLKHPFVTSAQGPSTLTEFTREQADIIAKVGRDAALGLEEEAYEEDEDEEDAASIMRRSSFVVPDGSSNLDFGTMVITDSASSVLAAAAADGFGTMVVTDNGGGGGGGGGGGAGGGGAGGRGGGASATPAWMNAEKSSKYSSYSTDQLQKLLSELEAKKAAEIARIQAKYA